MRPRQGRRLKDLPYKDGSWHCRLRRRCDYGTMSPSSCSREHMQVERVSSTPEREGGASARKHGNKAWDLLASWHTHCRGRQRSQRSQGNKIDAHEIAEKRYIMQCTRSVGWCPAARTVRRLEVEEAEPMIGAKDRGSPSRGIWSRTSFLQ